jgi:hypothetical protein
LPKDAEEDMGQEKRAIFNDMGQEPHFKRAIRVFNHQACTENQYSRQVQKHTTISSTSCVEYDGPGMERNRAQYEISEGTFRKLLSYAI